MDAQRFHNGLINKLSREMPPSWATNKRKQSVRAADAASLVSPHYPRSSYHRPIPEKLDPFVRYPVSLLGVVRSEIQVIEGDALIGDIPTMRPVVRSQLRKDRKSRHSVTLLGIADLGTWRHRDRLPQYWRL